MHGIVRPAAFGLVLAAALLGTACRAPEASTPAAPDPPPAAVPPPTPALLVGALHRGIDVSVHSGSVDWPTVEQAGHTFAFIKATEGVDLKDGAFDQHWQAMKDTGMVRGAYHFYVSEDDPEEQARFFTANVVLEPGDLAPMVDVELLGHGTAPGLAERLKTFLGIVQEHYGVRPIIYTSPNFWNEHLTDEFGDYPLWIAEYGVEAPRLPSGWQAWHIWQWQENAAIPGVEKGADLSHLNRDLDLTDLVVP
jgi:lysozyme